MSESRLEAKAGESRAIDPAQASVLNPDPSDSSQNLPQGPSTRGSVSPLTPPSKPAVPSKPARSRLQFADESDFESDPVDGESADQDLNQDLNQDLIGAPRRLAARAQAESPARSLATDPAKARERLEDLSDEDLVAAFREGRGTAYRTLIERYKDPLFNYLVRLLGSQSDADDAFQEVFLRVYRALPRFDPERRFKPWLYTIASNLVKNIYRSRAVRKKLSIDREMGDDSGESGGSLAQVLASADPGPLERASHGERARIVQELVAKLPSKGRQALVMHYFEGFSYEEIAVIAAVPLGTVKSRIHNAIKALVTLIGELGEDLRSA